MVTAVNLAPLLERVGVIPTPELMRPLSDRRREKQVTGGVRAGKSTEGALEVWTDPGLWDPTDNLPFWLIGGTYQATSEEFAYLAKWCGMLGMLQASSWDANGISWIRTHSGSLIETRSSQHSERIASKACRKIIVVEAGQQSEDVRNKSLERVLESGGSIVYTGTIEDDEAKPRYSWYNQLAEDYDIDQGLDTDLIVSYALPSWANAFVFPGGRQDPKILDLEARLTADVFDRRIGGKARGVTNAAYPITKDANFLVPMPDNLRWVRAVGGIDFGTSGDWRNPKDDHLTVLTAITVAHPDIAWVRECYWEIDYGSASQISVAKTHLSFTYRIPKMHWNVDPNQRFMAQQHEATAASSDGTSPTKARFGLVNGRLMDYRLYFDANGKGVPELYEEVRKRHYRKDARGMMVPVRAMDNRAASMEYGIEALDGNPHVMMPTSATLTGAGHTPQRNSALSRRPPVLDWGMKRSN